MQEIILAKLREIEQKENVRIIHAVESGSRAWGFPSPDSDYDVRFFYVRPPAFYLSLEKTRDVIAWQLDDTLDINGWDLQKTLRLLHGANPTVFEWCASPIVYHTTADFRQLAAITGDYFSEKASLHHYFNTARHTYNHALQGRAQVKLKKYFYVLRPLLACHWILTHHTPPPMAFAQLTATQLPQALHPAVDDLLRLKMQAAEKDEAPPIAVLDDFIIEELAALETLISHLPAAEQKPWTPLNRLFCRMIGLGDDIC